VRYPTDVVGDEAIQNYMDQNKAVEKKVKLGFSKIKDIKEKDKERKDEERLYDEWNLKVVSKVKKYDQSTKIFSDEKGKEQEKFLVRKALPPKVP
jgi:hypothetical protein